MGQDQSVHQEEQTWEEVCAAMAYEEEAAERAADRTERGAVLCCYCVQQCAGLFCELPLRCCFHWLSAASCTICSVPCVVVCGVRLPEALLRHHHSMLGIYSRTYPFLLANIKEPLTPWFIYRPARMRLHRPPRPNAAPVASRLPAHPSITEPQAPVVPGACAAVCDFCCHPCRMIDFRDRLFNRRIRTLFCVFSGTNSCHAATCVGPCLCLREKALRERGEAGVATEEVQPCCPCCCEPDAARAARWRAEFRAESERRTSAHVASNRVVERRLAARVVTCGARV